MIDQLLLLEDEMNQNPTSNVVAKWLVFVKLTKPFPRATTHVTHFFLSTDTNICDYVETFKERTGTKIDSIHVHPVFLSTVLN